MLCRDLRSNIHFVSVIEGLIGFQTVGIDDTSCLDLKLDRPVESKVEIKAIFVVGYRANRRNDQFSITGNVYAHVSEVSMFVEDTRIFFTVDVSH